MKEILLILSLRLLLSLCTRTYFQPDEYFQSLEVAHWMWYGYGQVTWEWKEGIRSVVYPGIYAIGYALGDWANLPVTLPPKVINALFATIQDIAIIAFMRREYGNEKVKSYTLLAFTNVYDLYTRHRSLSNTAEAALTSLALYYWPFHRSGRGKIQLAKSLVLISLAVAVRPTNVLIWVPLAVDLLIRRTVNPANATLLAVSIGDLALVSIIALDSFVYGSLTITPLKFIQSNIINSVSHFYGTSNALYYFIQAWPLLLNTSIIYAIKAFADLRTPVEKTLRNTIIFVTGMYTILAHKEWRFIQPLLPITMALTASRMTVSKKAVRWLAVGVIPALYLMTTHMRGQVEISEWVGNIGGVQSVGFYMPCHSTPWQSHIHRPDLTLYAIQCQPVGYNEEDDFYASPLKFMEKRTLEDVIIVFEALLIDYHELYAELLKRYQVTHSIFNSILHEDNRRRGDIVIFRRID